MKKLTLFLAVTFLALGTDSSCIPGPFPTATPTPVAPTVTQVVVVTVDTPIPTLTSTFTPTNTPTPTDTSTPTSAPTSMPIPTPTSATLVVTSAADSGSGTLRQTLLNAKRGDTITFDPKVFPPTSPVTISLTSGLSSIEQGNLTIDASNAGVILDGSNVGATPETVLLDDVSLTLNGGRNLVVNGDFGAGMKHWRAWDEGAGATRSLSNRDLHSSPSSYAWEAEAHAGEGHTVYDPTDTSGPLAGYPFGNTVWVSVTGSGTIELRFWYKHGLVRARLHVLFSDGHEEWISGGWLDWKADWTQEVVSQTLPAGAVKIALEFVYRHPDMTSGICMTSDSNILRGLQIVNFPDNGICFGGGAKKNMIGGDRSLGTGPLGQGNLISGNGTQGIGLFEPGTSFNTIVGNYIGTDLSGTKAWGNRYDGVRIDRANHNTVSKNVISGNGGNGIALCCSSDSSNNIVSDNLIGTQASGTRALPNGGNGVSIDSGASQNVIGPNNVIAYNGGNGIEVSNPDSLHNTITQNGIHDNKKLGVDLQDGGNTEPSVSIISEFDLRTGSVMGTSCANCIVEIFSDDSDEGKVYEGRATADDTGLFTFNKAGSFAGPRLTATTTDAGGNTSEFSPPTSGTHRTTSLQEENNLPRTKLRTKQAKELEDNRIGGDVGNWQEPYNVLLLKLRDLGAKWFRTNHWSPNPLNWQEVLRAPGVYSIPQDADDFITQLADDGINIVLTLSAGAGLDGRQYGWWGGPGRGVLGSREPEWWFKTQEDRDGFVEYTRFMVQHFKGRVKYYEIWNEPSSGECPGDGRGGITVSDYVALVKQVVPVIRQIDPEAKIVVGAMGRFREGDRQWLQTMLESGVGSLVDAVSWHAFSGESPLLYSGEYPEHPEPFYWRDYASNVQSLKNQAASWGFRGEYLAEEMIWRTPNDLVTQETPFYTDIVAAKYAARANIMHLGMDFTMVGNEMQMPDVIKLLPRYYVVRNLSTVMAGAKSTDLPTEIQSEATNIESYSFSLPNGDRLVALWTDGVAVDDDPGVKSTVIVPGFSAQTVMGIDVLSGFVQQLITETEGGNLVIRNLLIKDYPMILRLAK
jgi:parallel beta-helix repeat protein